MKIISIKTLFLFFILLGLLVPLSVGGYYLVEKQRSILLKNAIFNENQLADIVSLTLSKALWDISFSSVKEIVDAAFRNDQILKIEIKDEDNKIFYQINANDESKIHDNRNIFKITRDIKYGDRIIGIFLMEYCLDDIYDQNNENTKSIIYIILIQLFLCIFIVLNLMNYSILNPLKKLKLEAKKLAEKQLNKSFVWQNMTEIGELGRDLEKTRLSLVDLFSELELKNVNLKNINVNLESMVQERIESIRTILDHVKFGFFLVNEKLILQSGYSRKCEELFYKKNLTGLYLPELLNLEPEMLDNFLFLIKNIFEDDLMPAEIALLDLQKKIQMGALTLQMEGSLILDDSGKISKILFTIIDITAIEKIEVENNYNQILISILKNLHIFRDFISEIKNRISNAYHSIETENAVSSRMELHTIKGSCASYNLSSIVSLIGVIEDKKIITKEDVQSVEEEIKKFLIKNRPILKVDYETTEARIVEISEKRLLDLQEKTNKIIKIEELKEYLISWQQQIWTVKIQDLLQPIRFYIEKLVQDLNVIVQFKVKGDDIKLDPSKAQGLFQVIIHLFRNALDHGIEPPEERVKNHKPKQALLSLEFLFIDSDFIIIIRDDGRGINVNKLKDLALAKGFISQSQKEQLTDSEALNLVFNDGFSTAEKITDISGRGFGMSAVKDFVELAGGKIEIQSVLGRGTIIEIRVPKSKVL